MSEEPKGRQFQEDQADFIDKQLAAAREATKVAEDTMAWHLREAADLRKQLAAAVEALKEFEGEYPHVTHVLAKIG